MTQGGVCPRLAQSYEMLAALGFQAHLLSMPHATTASDCRRSCKTQSTRLGHDVIAAAILVTRCLLANAAVIHEYVLCCITHSHRARMRTQVHGVTQPLPSINTTSIYFCFIITNQTTAEALQNPFSHAASASAAAHAATCAHTMQLVLASTQREPPNPSAAHLLNCSSGTCGSLADTAAPTAPPPPTPNLSVPAATLEA